MQMLPADRILLDSFSKEAYGGTGRTIRLDILKEAEITKPYFLAGGLNPENLKGILDEIHRKGLIFPAELKPMDTRIWRK